MYDDGRLCWGRSVTRGAGSLLKINLSMAYGQEQVTWAMP